MIEINGGNKTKKHYIAKGYTFDGSPIIVHAEDLHPGSHKIVKLICDVCGKEFTGQYHSYFKRHADGKTDVCRSCSVKNEHSNTWDSRVNRCFSRLRNACDKNGYILLTNESEYTTVTMDVKYICPKHGVQVAMLDNLARGHKCYRCSYEERGLNCRHDADEVERIINSYNNNKLLNKEDYSNSKELNLRVLCGKCGKHVFTTCLDHYITTSRKMCRCCSKSESSGEKLIADYLSAHGIKFIREKKFVGCIDKKQLPFDFYVPQYNLVIEFDGPHHFRNVWNEEHYLNTKRHDEIKNQYCYNHNINILRISYLDGHNVDDILSKTLDDLQQVKDIV